MNRGEKLNIVGLNQSEIDVYCEKYGLKWDQIRSISHIEKLYGQWKGTVVVLPQAKARPDYGVVVNESIRRGMDVYYYAPVEDL